MLPTVKWRPCGLYGQRLSNKFLYIFPCRNGDKKKQGAKFQSRLFLFDAGVYAMGFNHPSKIQETAIPSLLADPPINMIAQSQSGTGKTAAFSVAMLSRVDNNLSYPQALLLSPTYELALQTGKVIETMAKYYTNFKAR